MKSEFKLLYTILNNPHIYKWESPIAHLVPRDPTATLIGDASLHGAGGYSISLAVYWRLEWPDNVKNQTLKLIKNNK